MKHGHFNLSNLIGNGGKEFGKGHGRCIELFRTTFVTKFKRAVWILCFSAFGSAAKPLSSQLAALHSEALLQHLAALLIRYDPLWSVVPTTCPLCCGTKATRWPRSGTGISYQRISWSAWCAPSSCLAGFEGTQMEHQPYKLSHSIKTALNKCWRFFSFLFSIFSCFVFRWSKMVQGNWCWSILGLWLGEGQGDQRHKGNERTITTWFIHRYTLIIYI